MEYQFWRNRSLFELSFKITAVQKFSDQIQILCKVVVKIQHWMQRIDNDLSAKFFTVLHLLALNINVLMHVCITNSAVKSLVSLLKKLMHAM